jgi:hypothetical protein
MARVADLHMNRSLGPKRVSAHSAVRDASKDVGDLGLAWALWLLDCKSGLGGKARVSSTTYARPLSRARPFCCFSVFVAGILRPFRYTVVSC